jgi:enoyl-CoA hydratase/carnithine racemase
LSGYERLRVETTDHLAVVTLDDAAVGNALEPFLTEAELADAFRTLDRDRAVRAIVLAASGDDFCVGGQRGGPTTCRDPRDDGPTSAERLAHGYTYGTLWEALAEVNKPLIASVRGRCRDGGFGLVLGCDVVVAGTSATFADNSIERGRSTFWPAAPVLVRALGKHRANEILLLGRVISAAEAQRLGFVTTVVEDARCDEAAIRAAAELAARPPVTVSLARHLIRKAVAEMADYTLTRSLAYHTLPGQAPPANQAGHTSR